MRATVWAVAIACFISLAGSGEEVTPLKLLVSQSDLVVAGKLTMVFRNEGEGVNVQYHLQLRVSDILRGGLDVREVWAKIDCQERNAGERHPLLQNGKHCILFLRRRDGDWWGGADPWLQVQPATAALARQVQELAKAGESP